MCPKHNWQPDLYDGKHGYVSAFGKDVVRLLRPEPGERILDVGCGTGDLAYEISKSGAIVAALDEERPAGGGMYMGCIAARRKICRVTYAVHFDRPTPMEDGERGLHHWLAAYAGSFFAPFTESEKADLFDKIAARLKPMLFEEGVWCLDYSRLRIAAVKP
ncbi:SAM-dependent methyltransferase [Paenibacillus sp. 32O-W]|uniref:class I SAM-dependent methyltransferase n=1 Tax=Paenibacillus sp. 32O-W TaxID=1695218 RepID=UPI00071F7F79|nr:SAM-dependent methyltransferase [Paenibacillus sp. 32O-W]